VRRKLQPRDRHAGTGGDGALSDNPQLAESLKAKPPVVASALGRR
jgi:hypothetical protein